MTRINPSHRRPSHGPIRATDQHDPRTNTYEHGSTRATEDRATDQYEPRTNTTHGPTRMNTDQPEPRTNTDQPDHGRTPMTRIIFVLFRGFRGLLFSAYLRPVMPRLSVARRRWDL